MARSRQSGIVQEANGGWKVDCQYRKQRIYKRGFPDYRQAEDWLTHQKVAIQQAGSSDYRPSFTLEQGATRYLLEKEERKAPSAETDAYLLKPLVAGFGSLKLEEICNETLAPFIKQRKAEGIKNKSINNALAIVNRISRLAATRWRTDNRQAWLASPSLVDLLELDDRRPPRPISWPEQQALLDALPEHLARMALFCLNSGARKNVVCQLRWDWEVRVKVRQGLEISVFVVPRRYVKGRKRERVLFCNSVGQGVIDGQRGLHQERVFTYFKPVKPGSGKTATHFAVADMNNTAWQRARQEAGLDDLHVHDLRHTVGMRLRLAGVSERTQDEILWHSRTDMSTLYAVAQIREVYEALELIAVEGQAGETINLMAIVRRAQLRAAK